MPDLPAFGALYEDRVLRVPGRVVRQHVERVEVVPLGFDLWSLRDLVAHRHEHVGKPVGEHRDRMPGTGRHPAAGQGHVDRLGDQHLPVTLGFELGLALLDRLAYPAARGAHPPSGRGAGLGRQRADPGAGQGQRRPVTVVREPRCLQLIQRPGGGDGREGLVEGPGDVVGALGGRLVIFVLCGHEGPASCGPYEKLRTAGVSGGSFSRTDGGGSPRQPRSAGWASPAAAAAEPARGGSRRACTARGVNAHLSRCGSPKGHYRTVPRRVAAGRRSQAAAAPAGTINRNSAPPPGAHRTPIVPPCASTRPLTI